MTLKHKVSRFSDDQVELLKEHGVYGKPILAEMLSELYFYDEWASDLTISDLISKIHYEIKRLSRPKGSM